MSVRHLMRTLGLALVAVLAMSAVSVASASAFNKVWETKSGGVFKPITGTFNVEGEGALQLSSGGITVECEGTTLGTVETAGKDKITNVENLAKTSTTIPCVTLAGTCETAEAKAVHLPWNTQLIEEGIELRDELKTSGAGNPGWAVTCHKTLLGTITETCTAAKGTTSIANLATEVEAKFDAKTEEASCTGGLSNKGTVRGPVFISAPGTEGLHAS